MYVDGILRDTQTTANVLRLTNGAPLQIGASVCTSFDGTLPLVGQLDEVELFSRALTVAPGMQIDAPDPSSGDGQYVVVVKGSLMYESKEHKAITVVFIKPDEKAFQIVAGAQGLEALILNFPRHQALAADGSRAVATLPGKRQCVLCDFSYDPAVGMPDDGIAAGTRWEDIPETWTCPDCGAGKEDFK